MWRLVATRLLMVVPLLWCVATGTFALVELAPGDPIDLIVEPTMTPELRAALVEKYCLDCPVTERYGAMLVRLTTLDLGRSISPGRHDRPVRALIAEALPHTMVLSALTLLWVYPVGALLGTLQALHRGRPVDAGISAGSLAVWSTPEFVIALVPILCAPRWLGLPTSGWVDPLGYASFSFLGRLWDHAEHLVLPVGAMGLVLVGGVARYARASVLEAQRQDFVRTARAKGLPERQVIVGHILRNALLPLIVRFGLSFPLLASGAVVIERAFGLPGMGLLLVQAGLEQDTPVLIGCLYVFCSLVVLGNLLADVVARVADPRTRPT